MCATPWQENQVNFETIIKFLNTNIKFPETNIKVLETKMNYLETNIKLRSHRLSGGPNIPGDLGRQGGGEG